MLLQAGAEFKDFRAAGTRKGSRRPASVSAPSADGIPIAVILTHVRLESVSRRKGLITGAAEVRRHVLILGAVIGEGALFAARTLPAVLRAKLLVVVQVKVVMVIVGRPCRLPAAASAGVARSHAVKRIERPEERGSRWAARERRRVGSGGGRAVRIVRALFGLRRSPTW